MDTAEAVCEELVSHSSETSSSVGPTMPAGLLRILRWRQKAGDDGCRRGAIAGLAGDGVVEIGIDGRLAVLGGDDDEGGLVEPAILELGDHFADGVVDQLDFAEEGGAGGPGRIQIAALGVAFSMNFWPTLTAWKFMPKMVGTLVLVVPWWFLPAISLQDGIDLEGVVALDVVEAVGPGGEVGAGVGHGGAGHSGGCRDPGQGNDVGVDLGRIEVVERVGAAAGDRGVGRMLVGPCGVTAGRVDDAEDGIGAHEIPGHRRARNLGGIAIDFGGVDGSDAAVGESCAGRAAVELGLVEVDAFFVLGGVAGGSRARVCKDRRRRHCRWCRGTIERAIIGDVVVDAEVRGRGSADDGHQTGERVGGPEVLAAM